MVTAVFSSAEGVYAPALNCGGISTEANGINDDDDIVGECNDGTEHGFLLRDGVYQRINYPGATGTIALGINNDGDIVGVYTVGAHDHGFLVTNFPKNPTWRTIDYPGSTT